MYHSGATEDLAVVIDYFEKAYDEIALVGFSLGGNLVLKYCGENGSQLSEKIKAAICFSVPTDLHAACLHIGRTSNYIYAKKFLISLSEKVEAKNKQFPGWIDLKLVSNIKTVFDFDDMITGPMHGFTDAIDYYTQCSCAQYIKHINIPSLIINALDDPFLPEACYPYKTIAENELVQFLTPKYGGHVGFANVAKPYYWSEEIIKLFLNEKSEIAD